MSYIGNSPTTTAFVTDTFSGNGSTTAFTMSVAPAATSAVLVAISGVLQDPSTYSVAGTTLTFSAAPPSGTGNISARYLGIPASGVATTAYRTLTEFTATSGQTTFSVPSYVAAFINVFRNGAMLGTADYTATNGTTVVLAVGAVAGDLIAVESFYVSSVLNAIPNTAGAVQASNLAAGAARANWGAGGVLQVVYATTSTQVQNSTTTYTDTTLTATITPSSASNKILVLVTQSVYRNAVNSNNGVRLKLFRDAVDLGMKAYAIGYTATATEFYGMASFNVLDTPATVSAVTYKTQIANNAASSVASAQPDGIGPSEIVLMEIAA